MLSLNDPVNKLHLVNASSEKSLRRLGINTIQDLLYYFPRDWQDLSNIKTIAEVKPGEGINLKVRIKNIGMRRTPWRHMHLTEALLEDHTGNILAVWFNQPFLKNVLREGREYYMSGKAQLYTPPRSKKQILQLQNPTFELVKENTIHTAGIIPVYELTENLTQKQIRYWLKLALTSLSQVKEHLPLIIRKRLRLPELSEAIRSIHFPNSQAKLEAARERLAFDELFLFQLALLSYKQKLKILPAPPISFNKSLIQKFVEGLPFKLTNSQRLAIWEILQDLASPHPMNRLLEGEVGSGKTVVAGIAMLEAAQAGFQSVLLAPTEILAWQHYQTLSALFKDTNIEIALLTRSRKITPSQSPPHEGERKEGVIIGTHALLQEKVEFHNIGLLVVDEQHRFGVKQRSQLQSANQNLIPHLLSMSATPIPRTLALAFYGDLDISELRELPAGRKRIITRLVEPANRDKAYDFIREKIKKGGQVYVVTPLIEESDKLGVKSATLEAEKLKTEIFPEFEIGLLHGRLPAKGGSALGGKVSKEQVMNDFRKGKIDILVSTTVIEVGMDVPNAAIMLIENAERFGLAQLHQLRGRVGRSDIQSYCLLFAETSSEYTRQRLMAVVNSTDGFELAEKDLELRGAGEILGTKQSGFIPFKIAKLSDRHLIKLAKTEAENLLDEDSALVRYPLLKQRVEILAKDAHLE